MKKWTIILVALVFLVGCNDKPDRDELLLEKYKTAYNDLVSNDKFETSSSFYDIDVAVNKIENNKFRVDAIIDSPTIAMYQVEIIAELDSKGVEQFEEVVPSLGIVDQANYNLIPYQVNKAEGFYAGLVVSGVSDKSQGEIILKITWTDYAETKSYEEYLKLAYDIEPVVEEIIEETESDDE